MIIDIQYIVCYDLRSKNRFLYKYDKFVKIGIHHVLGFKAQVLVVVVYD
jgi:hypothetical protein